jgi:hypothetical protein
MKLAPADYPVAVNAHIIIFTMERISIDSDSENDESLSYSYGGYVQSMSAFGVWISEIPIPKNGVTIGHSFRGMPS